MTRFFSKYDIYEAFRPTKKNMPRWMHVEVGDSDPCVVAIGHIDEWWPINTTSVTWKPHVKVDVVDEARYVHLENVIFSYYAKEYNLYNISTGRFCTKDLRQQIAMHNIAKTSIIDVHCNLAAYGCLRLAIVDHTITFSRHMMISSALESLEIEGDGEKQYLSNTPNKRLCDAVAGLTYGLLSSQPGYIQP